MLTTPEAPLAYLYLIVLSWLHSRLLDCKRSSVIHAASILLLLSNRTVALCYHALRFVVS